MSRAVLLALVAVLCALGVAHAAPRDAAPPLPVALLLAPNETGDPAFNDTALAGLDAARKHGRLAATVWLAPRPEDYDTAIDRLVADAPALIVGVGPTYAEAFRAASARHPRMRFLLLDSALAGLPNVRSVVFRGDEGSFLAGVVAAVESKRGRVGFVGGMDAPAVHALECGWETGVRWATKARFLAVRGRAAYIGTTLEAFTDPAAGEELARAMIAEQDVDVLYAAAGVSGLGVIAAARQASVKIIGIEADQHRLAPGLVITSMRKRLDRAIETAIVDVRRRAFQGGVVEMSLANGGVDLVLPGRLARATVTLVEAARAAVVSGRTPACVKPEDHAPAWNFPPRPVTSEPEDPPAQPSRRPTPRAGRR